MKGALINKGEAGYTYLGGLFKLIDNIQIDYNWLISDYVCYPQNMECSKKLSGEWCWMTGEELTRMIEIEDFQWIWGVLSAFPKDVTKDAALTYNLPQADGNNRIFQNPVSIQHPLAAMEIIAWDSSMTIIVSRNDSVAEKILASNPLAEDLEHYNMY